MARLKKFKVRKNMKKNEKKKFKDEDSLLRLVQLRNDANSSGANKKIITKIQKQINEKLDSVMDEGRERFEERNRLKIIGEKDD